MNLKKNPTVTAESPAPAAGIRRQQSAVLPLYISIHGGTIRPVVSSVMRPGYMLPRRNEEFSLPVRYKYVVIPGNNSRAVLAAFRRRPWWGPARKEDNAPLATGGDQGRRRKKLGRDTYDERGRRRFNLWWEMYASRAVIEAANLDANLRQAVNHFEFNATLVSKKGLHRSLKAYLASGGIVTLTNIVPETFYLAGGAMKVDAGSPHISTTGDDRAQFLAYCTAMDAASTAISNGPLTDIDSGITRLNSHAQGLKEQQACPSQASHPRTIPSGAIQTKATQDKRDGICAPIDGRLRTTNKNRDVVGCRVHSHVYGTTVNSPGAGRTTGARDASTRDITMVVHESGLSNVLSAERPLSPPTAEKWTYNSESVDTIKIHSDGHTEVKSVKSGVAVGDAPTWVVKPAANSNCGFGIQVCCSLQEVLAVVDDSDRKAGRNGWIVQRYIERPLLVRGRKFDIRMFVLLVADPSTRSWRRRSKAANSYTTIQSNTDASGSMGRQSARAETINTGQNAPEVDKERTRGASVSADPCPVTAWCHEDAYVRTSSVKYSSDPRKAKDRFVHLTNNAVQRRSPSYGRDEPGNKLTLVDLQNWLDDGGSKKQGKAKDWVEETLRPRMHALVAISVAAAAASGINKSGRPYAFELLGYDFMVDDDLQVWLIEVNSNPCLEFVCPLLQKMIQRVVDDTLSVAVDSVFHPPEKYRKSVVPGDAVGVTSRGGFSRVYPGDYGGSQQGFVSTYSDSLFHRSRDVIDSRYQRHVGAG